MHDTYFIFINCLDGLDYGLGTIDMRLDIEGPTEN